LANLFKANSGASAFTPCHARGSNKLFQKVDGIISLRLYRVKELFPDLGIENHWVITVRAYIARQLNEKVAVDFDSPRWEQKH